MSDRVTEIIYNLTGQTVELYPPEWVEGVPSSATCEVFAPHESNDGTAEFTPTVTVDSTSVALTAAAGYAQANRRTLTAGWGTALTVARRYVIANVSSQRELITPIAATTSTATLQEDLAYDYPVTTSTVKGIRMTFPVDATWVADESKINGLTYPPYRVLWTYTVATVVRKHWTYLRLSRQKAKHGVTHADLTKYHPDLLLEETRERRGQQFAYAIDAAWERVRLDLRASDIDPDRVRETEVIDGLVIRQSFVVLAEMGVAPGSRDPEVRRDEAKKAYDGLLLSMVRGPLRVYIDTGNEGVIARQPVTTLWLRR